MARGVNKVILIGNLGKDPETRYTASNMAICTLTLATTERHKSGQSGEWEDRTEWHRIKLFGKLAEISGQYLKKGRQVYIEGSIHTDKFTGKDGQEKYFTEIIANNMQMLGGQGGDGGEGGYAARPPRAPRPAGGQGAPQAAEPPPPADDAGFGDDDIPF